MRILGIDPGYGILGWSVVEDTLKLVDFGVIETSARSALPERLCEIYEGMKKIIEHYRPGSAAIEKLYFSRNTTTALDVARCLGVVILALKQSEIEYSEYSPSQVKLAVSGYGKAGKGQMQTAVKMLFGISDVPRPDDAADAAAVAACHCLSLPSARMRKSGF